MESILSLIVSAIEQIWNIIELWWWVPMPFLLWRPFLFMWRWWKMEGWAFAQKKVLLEIKMPKEVLKPIKSMEQVFSAIWGNSFDPPDWSEYWLEGKDLDAIQLEMISLGGEPHIFIRCTEGRRNAIESSIYSQYPEAEISTVDDYVKNVPQSVPNKEWEIWGTDYMFIKPEVYPIRTYSEFFEETESAKEEKRIDPMATLLEGMAKLGPGEQLWIQISAAPVISSNKLRDGGLGDFAGDGRKIADKLAKRPQKEKPKSILVEAYEEAAYGKMPGSDEGEKMKDIIPPEMRLTPGEKIILEGVEGKIAKRCFKCFIRFMYLAKREVYFGGAKGIPFGYFNQFATENLNALKPWPQTITKVKRHSWLGLFRTRRVYLKKRRLFFRYSRRMPPLFPQPSGKGVFILNTEELATIFHFPGRAVTSAPFVSRVESRRGEAPPGLPMEE